MNKKLSSKQLHALKSGVIIFAPLYLYSFLKLIETRKIKREKGIGEIINEIAGLPLSEWPPNTKEDYYALSETLLNLDQLKNTFAEIHYFLIYTIAGYTSKYTDQNGQELILDALFDLFNNKQLWGNKYPENNAFTKYRKAQNLLLEFSNQISKTAGVSDSLLLFDFSIEATSINKFFIQPALDKIFID